MLRPMSASYETYRRAFRGRHLPFAFCDLDLFDRNVADIRARAGTLPVRVASKSVRVRALLARILEHEGYRGVMCFSAEEACFLADHGFDDLLVAYPTLDPDDVTGVLARVAGGKRIALMVDDVEQVAALDAIAAAHGGATLRLCIDVDMSTSIPGLWFGVRRSPIHDASAAVAVARAIDAAPHLTLAGVMGYEAQIAGIPDAVPGKAAMNAVLGALKRRSVRELTVRRDAVVSALETAGFALELVNGGGTGSLETTRADRAVTELTAGSGFFAPALFDAYRAFHHAPAAGFALAATRRPAPGIVTCHGGGYVASGAAGPDKLPAPYLPEGAALLPHEGAGEVQTPVALPTNVHVALGDPIFFRHAKAGELCERFATMLLLAGGEVVDEVPTYRGEGRTFV
jgi:D-serine deaminase-like pyridoxal phosphate-dependent protein